MSELIVYPFKGIMVNGQYVPFESDWKTVERILGKPEHRYVGYTPEEALAILQRRGEHIRDYKDDVLPKGDFEEDRQGILFIYREFCLYCVQPDSSYTVFIEGNMFKGNGMDDFAVCYDKYETEVYEYFHKFSVKELGMICSSRARGGQYEFYSAIGFVEECVLHRVAHDCVMQIYMK